MHLKFDIDNSLKIFLPQNLFQYTGPIRTYFAILLNGSFIIHVFLRSFRSIQAGTGSSNPDVLREIVA